MRFIPFVILLFVPALAIASPNPPKDKYICDCHLTPGVSSLHAPKAKPVHRHNVTHKSTQPAIATASPATPDHRPSPKAMRTVTLDDKYPGRDAIVPSNKLALPAGKSSYAKGELVFLSGRVLDENCVPVSDAIVDIWQLDPEGHYVRSTLGDRISPDPHFTGSGRAITNNLGQFNFVTLFPGMKNGQAPHINVHVIHKDLGTLDTQMFFEGERYNAEDPRLGNLPPDQQKSLMAKVWQRDPNDADKGLSAQWDISIKGKNPWRHF